MRGQIYIPILLITILLGVVLAGGFVGTPKPKYYSPTSAGSGCGTSSVGNLDMGFYIQNWNFQQPTTTDPLPSGILAQLKKMVPFACQGAAAYDIRYHEKVTPQLIVWWSYVEGINGNASFSNCRDISNALTNCDLNPSNNDNLWQLGYGIQFAAVPALLKPAFTDLHSGETAQSVGQHVLQLDGSSQTFPANLTVDRILSGVNAFAKTDMNWWASILARDPAINSYINAAALTPQGLPWSGWMSCNPVTGLYCKPQLSNKLAQILQAWPQLVQ